MCPARFGIVRIQAPDCVFNVFSDFVKGFAPMQNEGPPEEISHCQVLQIEFGNGQWVRAVIVVIPDKRRLK
jgi:hypothetical protein